MLKLFPLDGQTPNIGQTPLFSSIWKGMALRPFVNFAWKVKFLADWRKINEK